MGNSNSNIKFLFCITFSFITSISLSQTKFLVDQDGIRLNEKKLELPLDSTILHGSLGKSTVKYSGDYGTYFWHKQGLFATFLTENGKITGFGFTFSKKQPKSTGHFRSKIKLTKCKRTFFGQLLLLEEQIDKNASSEQLIKLGFEQSTLIELNDEKSRIDFYSMKLSYGTIIGYFCKSKLLSIFIEFNRLEN